MHLHCRLDCVLGSQLGVPRHKADSSCSLGSPSGGRPALRSSLQMVLTIWASQTWSTRRASSPLWPARYDDALRMLACALQAPPAQDPYAAEKAFHTYSDTSAGARVMLAAHLKVCCPGAGHSDGGRRVVPRAGLRPRP